MHLFTNHTPEKIGVGSSSGTSHRKASMNDPGEKSELCKPLFVYFVAERGNVGKFVAKLNIIRNGKYIEIARYDSGLHEPHLDIFGPDGDKRHIIDYSILENDQALNVAIQDFKNNWNAYIERWDKWREEKK